MLHCLACGSLGRDLGGVGRALTRALEARRAGTRPGDDVSALVGERDDRVVEGRLDVSPAPRNVLPVAAANTSPTLPCRTPSIRHVVAFLPCSDRAAG